MRLVLTLALCLGLSALAPVALAQPDAGTARSDDELTDEEIEAELDEEEASGGDDEPTLRAPMVEEGGAGAWDDEEEDPEPTHRDADDEEDEEEEDDEESEDEEEEEELPDPDRVEERLDGAGTDPTVAPWSTPATIFELHGYMRMRGEFMDQFSLGRGRETSTTADEPFEQFITYEDRSIASGTPAGGCNGARGDTVPGCNQRALAFANMRLRLEPAIHLSDDVRVRMQIDVFDNLVMGSTPDGYGTSLPGTAFEGNSAYVPLLSTAASMAPSISGRNSITDSIVARRAWAEVRNRGLGEIRFGRMGNHWGLGILANDGRGIDQDYQTDVDRIMLLTRLFGFYFFGAWDFASEGMIQFRPEADYQGLSLDRSRNDDVDQFTFGVARRSTPEETTAALARGEAVLNAGLYFVYRTQNLTSSGSYAMGSDHGSGRSYTLGNPDTDAPTFVRRGFELYVPDVWVQFLYENLRLEVEAVMQIGTIDNLAATSFNGSTRRNVLTFGVAFEGEYHLLNNQLGIYFNAGFASGDADSEGLTLATAYEQVGTSAGPVDSTISTMGFHPGYRVDLIFWRTIMRQIAGAYYFAPGVSYDFIHSAFGQVLGARANVIWSRASEPVQTWGNNADLGVEINAAAYYRSEDGPDLLDGFYAQLQYGIFFPLGGLGFITPGATTGGGQNAQTLRLVLGVTY